MDAGLSRRDVRKIKMGSERENFEMSSSERLSSNPYLFVYLNFPLLCRLAEWRMF